MKKLIKLAVIVIITISIYQLFTITGTATTKNGNEYSYRGGIIKVCTGTEEAMKDME